MRQATGLAALLLATSGVSGHYIFQQLGVGGAKNPLYKYIRQNTNYNSPVTSLSSPDLRCNEGGASGARTETVSIKAGDSITFYSDVAVYHQGPVAFYMSRAPGSAASYSGDGGWFKIHQIGPNFPGGTWPLSDTYTVKIPECLPSGEYLVRIEQLGIHNPGSTPQFYISCAQVKISGSGTANPPTVQIPGHVKASDPGYTANIYNNFNSYTIPGPAVWKCGDANGGSPIVVTPMPEDTIEIVPLPSDPEPTPEVPSCSVQKWQQCGGQNFAGCTNCAGGSTCSVINDYYHQCT